VHVQRLHALRLARLHLAGDLKHLALANHGRDGADAETRDLFEREDWERGYFESVDRQGHEVRVPPVTLSLAVLDSRRMGATPHPATLSALAASLKKKVKELSAQTRASAFMFERRARP
jgi:hypothetical protein